jgi:hypothetical protein
VILISCHFAWLKVKNPNAPAVKARGGGGLGFLTLDKVKKSKPSAVMARRFPPPWSIDEGGFVVIGGAGQKIANSVGH